MYNRYMMLRSDEGDTYNEIKSGIKVNNRTTITFIINSKLLVAYYTVDEIYEIIDHLMAHLDTQKTSEITFDSFYKWFQDKADSIGD